MKHSYLVLMLSVSCMSMMPAEKGITIADLKKAVDELAAKKEKFEELFLDIRINGEQIKLRNEAVRLVNENRFERLKDVFASANEKDIKENKKNKEKNDTLVPEIGALEEKVGKMFVQLMEAEQKKSSIPGGVSVEAIELTETRRELKKANQRIQELESILKGLGA